MSTAKFNTVINRPIYDRLAPVYDTGLCHADFPFYLLEHEWVLEAIEKYVAHDGSAKVAADLGCATGLYTFPLLERGYQVTGIDYSPVMLAELRSRLNGHKAYFTPKVADLESGKALPPGADVILAVGEVINHLQNWDKFIGSVAASLKPGGIVILTVDNVLGLDFLTFMLYSRLFRWRFRPPITELARRIESVILNKSVVGTWPIGISQDSYELRLVYRPMRYLFALLKRYHLRVVRAEGICILSSLVPYVVYSESFPVKPNKDGRGRRMFGWLHRVDRRLNGLLRPLGAVRGIVAVKEGQ